MAKLMAGTAKVCITPPVMLMPAKSFLPIDLEDVYKDIYVRALVLQSEERKFVFINIESGDMSRTADFCAVLNERFGLRPEDLFFTVTHTHEAPSFANEHLSIISLPEKLAWVTAYGDFVIQKTVECVDTAIHSLRDARWGYGSGKSYINVCRDQQFEDGTWDLGYDFEGPSDKELSVLKVIDSEGRLIAALLNYAVHGTVCFFGADQEGKKHLISGDLPGMICEYLETRFEEDHAVFLWTSGAAGDQAPNFFPTYARYHHDKSHDQFFKTGYACWGLCEHLAQTQSIDAIRILNSIRSVQDSMKIHSVDRTLHLPSKPSENGADGGTVSIVLKLVLLDNTALFGVGGELVSQIGQRLKALSPVKQMMILTHIAERIDYLPDRIGFLRGTFEGTNTRVKDGCAEDFISNAMLEMFRA